MIFELGLLPFLGLEGKECPLLGKVDLKNASVQIEMIAPWEGLCES